MNSAPSLLTKDLKDLSLDEAVHSSVVLLAVILAILIGFAIKTYLHQNKSPKPVPAQRRPEGRSRDDAALKQSNQPLARTADQMPAAPCPAQDAEQAISQGKNGT